MKISALSISALRWDHETQQLVPTVIEYDVLPEEIAALTAKPFEPNMVPDIQLNIEALKATVYEECGVTPHLKAVQEAEDAKNKRAKAVMDSLGAQHIPDVRRDWYVQLGGLNEQQRAYLDWRDANACVLDGRSHVRADALRKWLAGQTSIESIWVDARRVGIDSVQAGERWIHVEAKLADMYLREYGPPAEPMVWPFPMPAEQPKEKRGLSMFADPFAKWPKCHKCSEKAGKYVGVKHYDVVDYDVVDSDIVTMRARVKATCHHETWTHQVDIYQAWHGSEPYALFAPGYDK